MRQARHTLIGLLLVLWGIASPQRMQEQWRELYNGGFLNRSAELRSNLLDSNGNSYHVGTLQTETAGPIGMITLSLAPSGTVRWLHHWGIHAFPFAAHLDSTGNLQVFTRYNNSIYIFHYTLQGELVRLERCPIRTFPLYAYCAAAIDSQGNRYLWVPTDISEAMLVKFSPTGVVEWVRSFPNWKSHDVYVDTAGNVVVSGGVLVSDTLPRDHFAAVAKLDAQGNLLWSWQDTYVGPHPHYVLGEASMGRLVISYSAGALVFSSDGSTVQYIRSGGSGWYILGPSDHLLHPDGRIFCSVLYRVIYPSRYELGLICYDLDGSLLWERGGLSVINGVLDFLSTHSHLATHAGSDAVWFYAPVSDNLGRAFLTLKLDAAGNTLWSRRSEVSDSARAQATGLLVDSNGQSLAIAQERYAARFIRYTDEGALLYDQHMAFLVPTQDVTTLLESDGMGGVYALIDASGMRLRRYSPTGTVLWEHQGSFSNFAVNNETRDIAALTPSGTTLLLTRYTREGQMLWQQSYPLAGSPASPRVYPASEDTFYIFTGVNNRPILLKIASDGQLLWSQTYPENASFVRAVVAPDDAVYLLLWLSSTNLYRIVRYNPSGVLEWQFDLSLYGVEIGTDSAGRLVVAGNQRSAGEIVRILQQYAPSGELRWESTRIGATAYAGPAVTSSGDIYIGERVGAQVYLSHFSSTGAMLWQQPVVSFLPASLSTDAAGNAYLWGTRSPSDTDPSDQVEVYRYAPTGIGQRIIKFPGPKHLGNSIRSLLVDQNGRFITIGGSTLTETGGLDAFIVRYKERLRGDADGNECVDDADFLMVLFAFGSSGEELSADLDGDGIVGDADLLEVLSHFGNGC